MLIKYQYRDIIGKVCGWYQADKDDFMNLFKNSTWRDACMWCKVDTGKEIFMWTHLSGWFKPKVYTPEELEAMKREVFGGND